MLPRVLAQWGGMRTNSHGGRTTATRLPPAEAALVLYAGQAVAGHPWARRGSWLGRASFFVNH